MARPADWALQKASDQICRVGTPTQCVNPGIGDAIVAFARYIALHEEDPAPDELRAAREASIAASPCASSRTFARAVRSGAHDSSLAVKAARLAYKAGKAGW